MFVLAFTAMCGNLRRGSVYRCGFDIQENWFGGDMMSGLQNAMVIARVWLVLVTTSLPENGHQLWWFQCLKPLFLFV